MFELLAPVAGAFGGSGAFGDDVADIFDPGGFFHQKKGPETSGITTTEPWAPQGQLMQDIWRQARIYGEKPIEYYPGQTIAGFNPEQIAAQNQIIARATQGSPLLRGAQQKVGQIGQGGYLDRSPDMGYMQDVLGGNFRQMQDALQGNFDYLGDATSGNFRYLDDTLSGKYLSPETNPYLSNYVQRAYEEALPQVDTTAMQAGRYGSDVWGAMKGRTMADVSSNIYGQAYDQERARQAAAEQYATGLQTGAQQYAQGLQTEAQKYAQGLQTGGQQYATGLGEEAYQQEANRQMQALGMAPEMAREDYYDMAQRLAVGEERQAMEQARIEEAIKKFEFQQMEPWERLGMVSNLATGSFGGTTASTASQRGK